MERKTSASSTMCWRRELHLSDGAQVFGGDPSVKIAAAGPPPKVPRRTLQLPFQGRDLRLLLLDPLLTGFGGLHLQGKSRVLGFGFKI